jgi:GT2 family glycosyltransferase
VDITILIINWNSGDYLEKLLRSLEGLAGRVSGILVLDNASGDLSADCVFAFPGVVLERMERNIGFSAAVNRGFGRAESKYILLLNPDVEFENCVSTVTDLYMAAESFERAAIVTSPLYDLPSQGGKSQAEFQVRPYPSFFNTLADLLFIDEILRLFGHKQDGELRGTELESGVMELSGQPAAALWLVRKSAWEEAGGMDERFYPAWFEDVDFCLRVREQGWKILFSQGKSRVFHKGGSSLESLGFSRFLKLYYRNLLRYWWKHHPVSFPVIVAAVAVGYVVRRTIRK